MAFDQSTRNRLARFVSDARALLTEEFTRQLQHEYGMDPTTGEVTGIDRLTALDDSRRETARILRETMEYYLAGNSGSDLRACRDVLDRIVREQAFTVLNRLCALRMAEARGFVLESIAKGYQSIGFQLYARLAGTALGETGDAYRCYLFSLFDEFAVDLPVLFDRFSPQGRLFPREAAQLKLLQAINSPEIDPLWVEDETIGWIYQYFNSKEERKAMRDASQAPRDSRELAVRNQFFTPRYVVEFLTDNTLGRIWYEMTRGKTVLKDSCRYMVRRPSEVFLNKGEEAPVQEQPAEELSQEQLLHQPVFIPHRPLKDPREIKLLDPACGSMHFGLYAFDLFERIYDEAWDLEEKLSAGAFTRVSARSSLHETYDANKEAFLKDIPRLIIEGNIHGIDIDPRAVQIAGLSLWLRAQKSWQSRGLNTQERPAICRSNIVCAEPMPGDRAQLEEFLTTLREDHLESLMRKVLRVPTAQQVRATKAMADALAGLVRAVWQEMELAGEAGSLLKIEDTLRKAISQARAESEEKAPLFRVLEYGFNEPPTEQYVRVVPGEEEDFWNRAEVLVLGALKEYSERAENGVGFRRRLFAGDAAQGFAFVDLCRNRYDVVLMNPPFGEFSKQWKSEAAISYPNSSNDILGAFVDSFLHRIHPGARLGTITSRTCFFLTTFAEWRNNVVLKDGALTAVADLGQGVMDEAMVEAAAYVLERSSPLTVIPFVRAIAEREREPVIDACVNAIRSAYTEPRLLLARQDTFRKLPGAPFVYWVRDEELNRFDHRQHFEPEVGEVRQGLATGDDPRFCRAVWEVPPEDTQFVYYPVSGDNYCCLDDPIVQAYLRRRARGTPKWAFHVKAGSSQPWYSPITLMVNWCYDGAELRNFTDAKGKLRSRPQNLAFYYRPGFSWTLRAVRFYPYVIPGNCIPSVSRYMAFPKHERQDEAIGVSASRLASAFMRFYGEKFEWPKFLVETLKMLPWPIMGNDARDHLKAFVEKQVEQRRLAYQNHEPFHEFLLPSNLRDLSDGGRALAFAPEALLDEIGERLVAEGYGLSPMQAKNVERDLLEAIEFQKRGGASKEDGVTDEEQDTDFVLDYSPKATEQGHVSYLVGCAFGRWDVRIALDHSLAPRLANSFDPPPVCPPGMLIGPDALPAMPGGIVSEEWLRSRPDTSKLPPEGSVKKPVISDADYPLRVSWDGILAANAFQIGGPSQRDDIGRRVREVLGLVWKEDADESEQAICRIFGLSDLQDYFCKPSGFFHDHLKCYSKSRRQAPIYWPLSVPSCSYTLWLYYHRLTDQTLFTCVNDFVDPKLKQVADEAAQIRQKKGRSASGEKRLERLTDFEHELRDFREELLRVAKFWKPNLNDGVEITAAPLWKLFQHKPWQKRLRETWRRLEAGEYDWAHLAFSIWPDRVQKKCETDKSLAIAHGLEHLYEEHQVGPKRRRSNKRDQQPEEWDDDD